MAFVPSVTRTLVIQAATRTFTAGAFWDLTDPAKPSGVKDPDATLDITFDWSQILADMGNDTIASTLFILGGGLTEAGTVPAGALQSVLVSAGSIGTEATITCRITTASVPPRIDDRTVYLSIEAQ